MENKKKQTDTVQPDVTKEQSTSEAEENSLYGFCKEVDLLPTNEKDVERSRVNAFFDACRAADGYKRYSMTIVVHDNRGHAVEANLENLTGSAVNYLRDNLIRSGVVSRTEHFKVDETLVASFREASKAYRDCTDGLLVKVVNRSLELKKKLSSRQFAHSAAEPFINNILLGMWLDDDAYEKFTELRSKYSNWADELEAKEFSRFSKECAELSSKLSVASDVTGPSDNGCWHPAYSEMYSWPQDM